MTRESARDGELEIGRNSPAPESGVNRPEEILECSKLVT